MVKNQKIRRVNHQSLSSASIIYPFCFSSFRRLFKCSCPCAFDLSYSNHLCVLILSAAVFANVCESFIWVICDSLCNGIFFYVLGDAIFFHSNLLHCSGPNDSEKRRLAINVSFNEKSNSPVKPNVSPKYTKLEKVGYIIHHVREYGLNISVSRAMLCKSRRATINALGHHMECTQSIGLLCDKKV